MVDLDDPEFYTLTKEASLRMPTMGGIRAGIGDLAGRAGRGLQAGWDRAGDLGNFRQKADDLEGIIPGANQPRAMGGSPASPETMGRANTMRNIADLNTGARNAGAAAAGVGVPAAAMISHANAPLPEPSQENFDFGGYGDDAAAHLKNRLSSPFAGLMDEFGFGGEESADQSGIRDAYREHMGDNLGLMERWQLMDPQTRSMILAAILGGGGLGLGSALMG